MLELHDLHVRYGSIRALQGVSLKVARGELVALIGSNGAGKTTVLRTISGLLRPSQGLITFEGVDIAHAPTDRIVTLGISHCPEGRRIFGGLTVSENLRLGAVARRDKKEAAADLDMVLTLFPLLQQRLGQAGGTLGAHQQARFIQQRKSVRPLRDQAAHPAARYQRPLDGKPAASRGAQPAGKSELDFLLAAKKHISSL